MASIDWLMFYFDLFTESIAFPQPCCFL